ncbi:hypothetical protein CKO51_18020 [Rhodopirellula sp. SM50]|nr:hypothetical protein CKO51_18020 [Rhodopirellula sp. SM50]
MECRLSVPGDGRRYPTEACMNSTLHQRLAEIQWHTFDSACGFDSAEIPRLLVSLKSNDSFAAVQAANQLWNVVSHQANVGSNSVPTLPFLIELLSCSTNEIQSELLDIIYCFACHARMCADGIESLSLTGWHRELASLLIANRSTLDSFARSDDQDLVEWSELIGEQLDVVARKLLQRRVTMRCTTSGEVQFVGVVNQSSPPRDR